MTTNCIISEISKNICSGRKSRDANLPVSAVAATTTASVTFQKNNAKIYVPVVTLSI